LGNGSGKIFVVTLRGTGSAAVTIPASKPAMATMESRGFWKPGMERSSGDAARRRS
jgi:hypothetical protein